MIRQLITIVIVVLLCVTNSYAQKKYALLVGISNYHALNKANEWNNIHISFQSLAKIMIFL